MPEIWCWPPSARSASPSVCSGWIVTGLIDHARFEFLHPPDFVGLRFGDVEVLVDDADAAELGHGDGHRGLGDGVHGRADEGDVEVDGSGQAGSGADRVGEDLGVVGDDEDVVEGEGFFHALVGADAAVRGGPGGGVGEIGIGRHGGPFMRGDALAGLPALAI